MATGLMPMDRTRCARTTSARTIHEQPDLHEILGTAHSEHDLLVFLEGAGIADPEAILDDLRWVEWRGGPAHQYSAA
ncbi:hypothetical protein AB0L35_10800 [Streptomyces sp. NPDC052309]|uniref:hypothetical protein n=1 Tax=Streptomyces sp. NPDC052309 TaxID=3155421 RepID=UPI0034297E22